MVKWTPELVEYMKSFIPGHSEKEIKAEIFDKFGVELSKYDVKNFKSRHGIRSGTVGGRFEKGQASWNKGKKMPPDLYEKARNTMFKKGNTPVNHKPVGSERVNVDGYVEIKVAEPNKWRLKQRCIWEEHYGEKLTQNDVIIFIDGNKLNLSIDNLCKLTRAELVRLNQDGYKCDDPEINKVAISIAKIKARYRREKM